MGGTRSLIHGLHADTPRTRYGLVTDALRSSCFRGTPVERAGVCSSVVRSAFVRRSVASCVAFVLCWFVWRSCAAAHRVKRPIVDVGASTFGHGTGRFATRGGLSTGQRWTCDGLLTGGGRAGIRLMPTFCDIPRWAVARRRTCHGRETDTPRAYHRRFPYGRATGGTRACLRASDGRATGGLRSDLDKPRRAKMGGGRLRGTRTGNGLAAR